MTLGIFFEDGYALTRWSKWAVWVEAVLLFKNHGNSSEGVRGSWDFSSVCRNRSFNHHPLSFLWQDKTEQLQPFGIHTSASITSFYLVLLSLTGHPHGNLWWRTGSAQWKLPIQALLGRCREGNVEWRNRDGRWKGKCSVRIRTS